MLRRLLVFAFVSFAAFAQEVELKPLLKAGDTFTMEILKTHEDSQRPQTNTRTKTLCQFVVDEAVGKNGFLLDVVIGETEVLESAQPVNPIVTQLAKAASTIHFKVRLNEGGDIRGVENEEALAKQLGALLAQLKQAVLGQVPEAQRETVEKAMQPMLQPALIQSSALEEVKIFFDMHGVSLSVGKPIEAEIQQVSPINGTPFPSNIVIELTKSDAAHAEIVSRTRPSPAAVTAMMKQLITQMGVKESDAASIPTVVIATDVTYAYDRTLGLMDQVDLTRRIEVGPLVRKDTWKLTLVTPPKR